MANKNALQIPLLTTGDEARAALGKIVQVRGTIQREKLGDTVNVGELSVRCIDFRFPEASVGHTATAEGTLDLASTQPTTTSPTGEISQGTAEAISSFVIGNCIAR